MRRTLTALLIAAALLLAACGSDDQTPSTPLACKSDEATYTQALAGAPDEVLLEGETPISDCIVSDQGTGDLSDVGAIMVTVATRLNTEAQKDPGGEAALQLGYLVGSVEEGASGTAGVHTDLVRRINAAARYSSDGGTLPAEFERTFGEGYAAAREAG
jgi:hypothetical protein